MTIGIKIKGLCAAGTLALMLGSGTAHAQSTNNAPPAGKPGATPSASASPKKPGNTPVGQPAGKVGAPAEVHQAVKQFRLEREKLLKEAQALAQERKDARPENRAETLEQLRERMQRLKEQQLALRKEVMDRMKEIKAELSPELGRNISAAQSEGRGR